MRLAQKACDSVELSTMRSFMRAEFPKTKT
jgi:hypothetical protein